MTTANKNNEADLATQLIAGIQKHLATIATLMFASGSFTPTEVEAQLQQLVTLRADVESARAALQAKLAAETLQLAALLAFMRAFVRFVKATYSKSPDILADFGLQPNKARTPLTVEQKATVAAKVAATRDARGTMGSKAKLKITGGVTGVVVTPVKASAPAAPAASAGGTSAPAPVVGTAGATTAPVAPHS